MAEEKSRNTATSLKSAMAVSRNKKSLTEAGTVPSGSLQEKLYLKEMAHDVSNIDYNFVEFAQNHVKYDGKAKSSVKNNKELLNEQYYKYLKIACTKPIMRGVSANNVAQSIGMYAGVMLFSREFREHSKTLSRKNSPLAKLSGAIDKKLSNMEPGSFGERFFKRDLQKARDIVKTVSGERIPFSPRTAALTHMAFTKQAYADMRLPGANVEKIQTQYNLGIEQLRAEAMNDGVTKELYDKNVNIAAGQLMEKDPRYACLFSETAFDGFKKAPPDKVVERYINIDGSTREETYEVWDGKFSDNSGNALAGTVNIRTPLPEDFYKNRFKSYFYESVKDCKDTQGIKEIFESEDFITGCNKQLYCLENDHPEIDLEKFSDYIVNDFLTELHGESAEKSAEKSREIADYYKAKDGQKPDVHPAPGVEAKRNEETRRIVDTGRTATRMEMVTNMMDSHDDSGFEK